MVILVTIPDYEPQKGFEFDWKDGFEIKVEDSPRYIELKANKEGLISLAQQFLLLEQDSFPDGYHLHYDSSNCLEDGSKELVVCKTGN
ncbi:MAG: hypothetical protein Q8938_11700 [Bacteroidota bacterium]|nr:hypothetical protein [Bacteroidota bacterium]